MIRYVPSAVLHARLMNGFSVNGFSVNDLS